VIVQAVANPGYAFAGWETPEVDTQSPVLQFDLNGPMTIRPRFVATTSVTIASSPSGLKVAVDGGIVTAPRSFAWVAGTEHTLAPVSPQEDAAGRYWVFGAWSNGAAEQQTYTVLPIVDPQVVTAQHVRGAGATVLTNPIGLSVLVDGVPSWPFYGFVWGVGSTHHLAAPLEQAGTNGRRYVFRSWSDGSTDAVRDVTVGEADVAAGFRIEARYELLGKLTVESSPGGLPFSVAGSECRTPCIVERPAGTLVEIVAPATLPLAADTRLDFTRWQDQGARVRWWTMTNEDTRATATYTTLHRLRTASDPGGGAQIQLQPASTDGFYGAGTQVLVSAQALSGFRFRRWGGDVEGTQPSAVVVVSQPRAVVAMLDRVPYIAPAGVINAAGMTPDAVAAPGSIIAIYGAGLALATEASQGYPLPQTLGGVTVQVEDRLLPLYYVSPQQINAVLPSDLTAGEHRVTARGTGLPEVSAAFQAARNAPGLFHTVMGGQAVAAALHEDGRVILPGSPARRGELITLLGTGFGPFTVRPPDGFAVPPAPSLPLADPVEIVAGSLRVVPEWAGATPGYAGLTSVRFRYSGAAPASGYLGLKVKVNGRESNAVVVPFE
jgi:uncharacterized protein (TIGR03437 family)